METKKTIVVLEALSNGRYYIPEIQKRGYEPIVIMVPNSNGDFPPAYEVLRHDTINTYYKDITCLFPKNIEEAYEMLAGRDIVAALSGTDYGTPWADLIGSHFNCPCNNPDNSALRYFKPAMQEALHNAGIRSIHGKEVSSLDEIIEFFHNLGDRKIVLKYSASAGSVGVHFCSTVEQIKEVYTEMSSGTDFFGRINEKILVQEYITGTEYIVNTISCNGVHHVTDIWVCDKVRVGAEGNAYNYYKIVTKPGIKHARLIEYVYNTLDALEFKYGPSHGEYFIDDIGPVLVEVGARPMGGGFSPTLFLDALDHYLVDSSLDTYINKPAFEARCKNEYAPKKEYMIKYLIAPKDQDVTDLPILSLMKLMPSVKEGNFVHCIEHSHIVKTIDLITAPAHVVLVHEDKAVVERDYQLIKWLEDHYFDFLFSTAEPKNNNGKNEHSEWEEILKHITLDKELSTVVICDACDTQFTKNCDSVVSLTTDDLFEHKEKYARVILTFNKVENFEHFFEIIIKATQLLNDNGELCFSNKTISSIPQGDVFLDIVLEIMGMSATLPKQGVSLLFSARKK